MNIKFVNCPVWGITRSKKNRLEALLA
jgi:hypothetical protein